MGTYRDKRSGSWIARTRMVNGKREYLGAFKTEEAAQKAFQVSEVVRMRGVYFPEYDTELRFELPKRQSFFKRLFRRA